MISSNTISVGGANEYLKLRFSSEKKINKKMFPKCSLSWRTSGIVIGWIGVLLEIFFIVMLVYGALFYSADGNLYELIFFGFFMGKSTVKDSSAHSRPYPHPHPRPYPRRHPHSVHVIGYVNS